jgi:tetratricopeptide (TPR) repeat protein
LFCHAVAQQGIPAGDFKVLFGRGNELMERNKPAEALTFYEQALALAPDNEEALYNAGMAAFMVRKYDTAGQFWKHLERSTPDDWRLRSKLVQVYQALGDLKSRDAERGSVLELWKHGIVEQEKFCRDQFEIANRQVMAFEYFELKGDRGLRYEFYVLDDSSNEDYRVSLGSYAATNAIWAEKNKNEAKAGQRLFHLDGYYKWGHATFGFFTPEPSYETVRQAVSEIVEGKTKPLSTTQVKKDGAKVTIQE